MRKLLILLFLFSFNTSISQEIVSLKEVYMDHHNLVYTINNDKLFTGTAQSKRKNGHLVYEEIYKNGIILYDNLYFNGKKVSVSDKRIYHPDKPFVLSKEHKYHSNGAIYETTTYNDDGIKILKEEFENGKLAYSCQYFGKKKHGLELGYQENSEKLMYRCEYQNGKRHGKEYCLNEDGVLIIKEYQNGKRIKKTTIENPDSITSYYEKDL